MTKHELLEYLATTEEVDAHGVAETLGVPYATAAMAMLRLLRQNLVSRVVDPRTGTYWYRLSDRGRERLAYFNTE